MESTDRLVSTYCKLNNSFNKLMVYHLGIDAGFFAEYTYMVNAMLYCLENRIRFTLYSEDANFGYHKGWNDFFQPFCEEKRESFHHRYNRHRTPSWKKILTTCWQEKNTSFLRWKFKSIILNLIGDILALKAYHQHTLMNHHIQFKSDRHFFIPELDIDGDYLQAFNQISLITWRLNEHISSQCNNLADALHLPSDYVGCQIRGGDKITEVSLISPSLFAQYIQRYCHIQTVFVLTDDYRIFKAVQSQYPHISWITLCSPDEHGYINKVFSQTTPEQKMNQMIRFLATIQILLNSSLFVGSITTGPSLFLLKRLYPNIHLIDCEIEQFTHAICLPIKERGMIAKDYLIHQKQIR